MSKHHLHEIYFVLSDNFLLAYLLTLAVAMTPGLMRKGIIQTQFSQISIKIGELLKGKEALKKEK